jgi:hypothetical protein
VPFMALVLVAVALKKLNSWPSGAAPEVKAAL